MRSGNGRGGPRAVWDRTCDWLVGSDPGFLRLQMAGRTTLTLAVTLGLLYLLTNLAGQPFTVALLGVVISMMISMAVNEPNPRQRLVTTALLPLPAAAAVTLGAVLADRAVVADVVFVGVMVAAVYARRWGSRGTAMGMASFMTYFFALFLGATVRQLPWLIGAIVIGAACSYLLRTFVFRDRPDRVLRQTLRGLAARIGELVEATADALREGQLDQRARRRLHSRAGRLNETVLMVESQLQSRVDAAELWPNLRDDDLAVKLFDAELAAERLIDVGGRVVSDASTMPAHSRDRLIALLDGLRAALRNGVPVRALREVQERAQRYTSTPAQVSATSSEGSQVGEPDGPTRLALAVASLANVSAELRELIDRADTDGRRHPGAEDDDGHGDASGPDGDRAEQQDPAQQQGPDPEDDGAQEDRPWAERLSPLTRQAVQVAIAASLAIIAGELLSSARWYWAVITAFVVFTGASSRGEVLTKGWQRLIGTACGVPAGVLIATAVGGDVVASLVLIFVCLFLGFYLIQVSYGWLMFWITAMLALLYGLLGQFSVDLLGLRLEETAVGAAIGVLVASVVLPTRTRSTIAGSAHEFLASLRDVVGSAGTMLSDRRSDQAPIDQASIDQAPIHQGRQLHQKLQRLRTSAEPITEGIAGIRGRGSVRRYLQVMSVCDHYGRTLARAVGGLDPVRVDEQVSRSIRNGAERTQQDIEALEAALDGGQAAVSPAGDLLDAAEACLDGQRRNQQDDDRRLRSAVWSLRHIDRAVTDLAREIDARATRVS